MDWMTMIGTYAFPIVACCAMAWYTREQTEKNRDLLLEINDEHMAEVTALTERHKADSEKFTEAINNNTLAMQKLCDKLEAKGVVSNV